MRQISLFGSGIKGATPAINSERRLNCFYEIVEDQNRTKLTVLGTPGTSLFSNIGDTYIRGTYVFNDTIYAVQGNSFYSVDLSGNKKFIAGINTSFGFVSMADNGTQLMLVDGKDIFCFTIAKGLVPVTAAGAPYGATTVAFIDGRFAFECKVNPSTGLPAAGEWQLSASYDGTKFNSLDFATAESNPDQLVALDTDHGAVVLWGDFTIEFWQNTGSLGFNFAPLRGATQQWGLAAKWSRAKFNNTIAFLGKNLQGQCQVMMLQNFTPVRISNHDIESIINSFPIIDDAVGMAYMLNGHSMYQITFPGLNRSFLYDGSTNIWSETQTGTELIGRHIANQCFTYRGRNYITDYRAGNIFLLSGSIYTDNGTPIKREIVSRHIENDGNVGSINSIQLVMATGVGLIEGQGKFPEIMMKVSRDGGNTYQMAERSLTIGAAGQYLGPRAIWRRCGSARSMVFKFTMTDPVKFAIAYATAIVSGVAA